MNILVLRMLDSRLELFLPLREEDKHVFDILRIPRQKIILQNSTIKF